MESLRLPERRGAHVSSRGCVAARGAEQSGVALSGDEVGLIDSVREGGGPVKGSAAGGETTNHETVREHLQAVAQRIEDELGEEREPRDFATLDAIAELPLPDGPMTVGLDG